MTISPTIFQDPRFEPAAAARYRGFAVAGSDGFSWRIFDETGQLLYQKSQSFGIGNLALTDSLSALRHALGSEPLLSLPLGSVECFIQNHWAALSPRRLFHPNDLATHLKLLLPPGDYHYQWTELSGPGCYLIYAFEPAVHQLLSLYFPGQLIRHWAEHWIGSCHQLALQQPAVCLHVRPHSSQLVVFDHQELQFYNSFSTPNPVDVLYFTLLAYEQCRLRPADTPLWVSGNLSSNDETWRWLNRYVGQLNWLPAPKGLRMPPDTGKPVSLWGL
jgi:Protein of unknown function (DUF3822)